MDEFSLLPDKIEKILSFQGYGRLSAPVWFIGIEEGLGMMTANDTKRNLAARGNFETVMDLRDAHLLLHEGGQSIDIEKKEKFTQVWQYMAKVMLARNGNTNWMELPIAEQYIRFRLGRCEADRGETFLTELSPIPAKDGKSREWYEWFKARLGSELDRKLENRKAELKQLLAEQIVTNSVPRLVICYSQPRASEFAHLLDIEWKFDPQCQQLCSAFRDPTRYLLLPFFGNGQMKHQVIADLIDSGLLV